MRLNWLLWVILILGLGAGIAVWRLQQPAEEGGDNQAAITTPTVRNIETPALERDIEVIQANLEIPWEVEFLPNGDKLITQRPGELLLVTEEVERIPVEGVVHIGEGGLLGVTAHPDFLENQWIYLYFTSQAGNEMINRVERHRLEGNQLTQRTLIIDGIMGSAVHDGGRIKFGPDGYLYITTGDAGNEDLAQDIGSLNGKILRLMDDGRVPDDNPFNSPVYSSGHRNPQGLAWDNQGQLWATEHGRSGIASGYDELNRIEKGGNYGWPVIQGTETREGMIAPVIQSGPNTTWAPAGAAYYSGSVYFAGLRGRTLYEYVIETGELRTHLVNEYGRLRAVVLGTDDDLYITTSNRDGRGDPAEEDDRLIRIDPESLD